MWALLPLKDFVQAKQRLSGALTAAERRSLFHAMVQDVLDVVAAQGFEQLVLVSDDPAASLLAEHYGAICWRETELEVSGLNAVVGRAAARAQQQGAQSVAVIHGDLPLISAAELDQLCAAHARQQADRRVTLATDRHGSGSNILLVSPPTLMDFAYGQNSCELHRQRAEAAGAVFESLQLAGVGRDIDNVEDIVDLLQGDWPGRAQHTLQYLIDSGIAARLGTIAAGGANHDQFFKEKGKHGSE